MPVSAQDKKSHSSSEREVVVQEEVDLRVIVRLKPHLEFIEHMLYDRHYAIAMIFS